MKKTLTIALLAVAAATSVHAQSSSASAPAVASSAAKKELINRLAALQKQNMEVMAQQLAEGPLQQMLAAVEQVLDQVPNDKRPAVIEQIEGLAKKYAADAAPIAKAAANKVSPGVFAATFESDFTEDELRQVLAMLESPAYKKYQGALPKFGTEYRNRLTSELDPKLTPRLQTLDKNIRAALGVSEPAAAPAKKAPAGK